MSHGGKLEQIAFLRQALARMAGGNESAPSILRGPAERRKVALGKVGACALDRALGGGIDRDGLHEIVAAGPADHWAASGFALALAERFAEKARGSILWVIEEFAALEAGAPYAPGLAAHGFDPDRLILVTAARPRDALWAMAEGLRERALAAVLGELRQGGKDYDLTASRRLLLAARTSGVPCLLLHAGVAGQGEHLSSAADTRFEVRACPSPREEAAAGLPIPGEAAFSVRLIKARAVPGFDRERFYDVVWDGAQGCLRDDAEPVTRRRAGVSRDGTQAALHEGGWRRVRA